MSETTIDQPASETRTKVPDKVRMQRAAKYHGQRALIYLAVFAALDAWMLATGGMMLAQLLGVVAAYLAGSYLAGVFHEWGHFAGARLSRSYSPIVQNVKGTFMFGFDTARNTSQQFLWMSIGGPTANWLLVLLVILLIPIDSVVRLALLATVFARAVSVVIFEGPVIREVMLGGEPREVLDRHIADGSLDRSGKYGHVVLAAAFLVGLAFL